MSKVYILNPYDYKSVLSDLEAGKKIAAIKRVRASQRPSMGLREAKMAVERLACEVGSTKVSHAGLQPDAGLIRCGLMIEKIICNYGTGPVEVDVETLQMRILSQMGTVGLDACADMLETVEVINALNHGKKVYIDPGDDEVDEIGL